MTLIERIEQAEAGETRALLEEAWDEAAAKVEYLINNLDITNADHIALWLEANIKDSSIGYMACRIIEAHEIALAAAALKAEEQSDG